MKFYTEKTFQRIYKAPDCVKCVPGPALVLGFEVNEAKKQLAAYFNGKIARKPIKENFDGYTFKIESRYISARNGAAGLNEFLTGIYNDPDQFGLHFLTKIIKTAVYGLRHGHEI